MPSVARETGMVRSVEIAARERAAIARQRAAAYWLLSRLVHEPPATAWLDELHASLQDGAAEDAPLAAEMRRLRLAVRAARGGEPTELELRAEHTRLWSGVSQSYGPPPPFESLAREGRLPGTATATVAAAYDAAGLAAQIADAGPADHLASELRFMSLCAVREAEAWNDGREAQALEWQDRQREFLREHLLAWAPAHCSKVSGMARTDYHRATANLVAAACDLDGEAAGVELSSQSA